MDDRQCVDLPIEILLKIFGYLHNSDRQVAALVCKRWRDVAYYNSFQRSNHLHLFQTTISDSTSPIVDLLNSSRIYPNITFEICDFGNCDNFWKIFGATTESLSFLQCDINDKIFNLILNQTPNLRSLSLENCRELLMSGKLLDNAEEVKDLRLSLSNVKILNLANNRYLSDALLSRFIQVTSSLEELNFSGCYISFHKALFKRFYPQMQEKLSESILTFLYIVQIVESMASTIKKINLSSTLVDKTALEVLAIIDGLSLESVILQQCDQLTNPGVINLVQHQRSITHLNLSFSVRITDQCVIEISKLLPKLKELKLRRCRALTDKSISEISNLTQLTYLDISECECITDDGIIKGVGSASRAEMTHLHLSALNITDLSVLKVSQCCPNLEVLNLSFCVNALSNSSLQIIFKQNIWLQELYLDRCDRISDDGMTGAITENTNHGQFTVESSIDLSKNIRRINLGSKAEEEIKRDTECKRLTENVFKLHQVDNFQDGYQISRLKGLRVLKLAACNKISDVSFKFGFSFMALKELSLAKCQQLTFEGIKCITENARSLEILDLSECFNIDDSCVKIISEKLFRLKSLSLERCYQLTEHSLDYIEINSKSLQFLDIRFCKNICLDPHVGYSRIWRLKKLKQLLISNNSFNLDENDFKTNAVPKPPPFFLFRNK